MIRLCLDHLTANQQAALERDLELARQIQTTLLPRREITWNGWETYYHFEPASVVSGDYCDLIQFRNGTEGLFSLTGDVSGKGIVASRYRHAFDRAITFAIMEHHFHTLTQIVCNPETD